MDGGVELVQGHLCGTPSLGSPGAATGSGGAAGPPSGALAAQLFLQLPHPGALDGEFGFSGVGAGLLGDTGLPLQAELKELLRHQSP